jgi:predicted permease
MLEDVRLALRRLRRSPGFTAAGVLVLAVGIGGSTAVFSVLRSVVLRKLAVPAPEQLVRLYELPAGLDQRWPFPAPDYFDLGQESRSFQSLTAIRPDLQTLSGRGTPAPIRVARVTSTFFDTLKVWPVLGGVPDATQDLSGAARTAVVTDGFWRRELGGDSAALGRTIVLDGRTYTVGGVMGPDFRFPLLREAEVLLPAAFEPFEREYQAWLDVIGRLKPGVSVHAAQADLDVVAPRIFDRGQRFGQRVSRSEGRPWRMQVQPLLEDLVAPAKPALTALFGAVLLTLLIACANVASLLLARGMSRQRELAVRAALGGGRLHLVRHLMIDALVVAFLGGSLAVLFAPWALSALLTLAPRDLPRLAEIRVDGVVLAFAVVAAATAGIVAGLVPALQLTRPQLMEVLRNGSGGSENPARARAVLVVTEIALAFVLAAGAGLMVRTLRALVDVDSGLAGSERVLVANLPLPRVRYPDDRIVGLVQSVLQSECPGVRSVALMTNVPLEPAGRAEFGFSLEGESFPPAMTPKAEVVLATPGYLATMGIPLVSAAIWR